MGWGVLELLGTRLTHVAHGIVHAAEDAPLADRLVDIDDGLRAVMAQYSPKEAAIESIFFAKDASAASKLGHARGVILLALRRGSVLTHEYAPAMVKRAVGASGRADKAQVARMVQAVLRLKEIAQADAADALAIAITHIQSAPARAIAERVNREAGTRGTRIRG